MAITLKVALNLYLPEPPRKIHFKKCIFTFFENVTNYALIVLVQLFKYSFERAKHLCYVDANLNPWPE